MAKESELNNLDCIILAVAHDQYRDIDLEKLKKIYVDDNRILIDIKGVINEKCAIEKGYVYWSL